VKLLDDTRQRANKGLVLESKRFVGEVEALTGKSLKEGYRLTTSPVITATQKVVAGFITMVVFIIYHSAHTACGVFSVRKY
jgi:hypothetical protein